MSLRPAMTRVIKAGRSTPFLLFLGNRKQDENEPVNQSPTALIAILTFLVVTVLGICIYGFLTGRLG